MKPSMAFPLISLLLALAATSAVCDDNPVLDTNGKPLRPGVEYFIVPASGGNTGGFVPASRDILHICTLDVVQALLPYQPGLPVTFSLPGNAVQLSTDLNIEFQSPIWICPSTKFWRVDYSSSERVISTNGELGGQNSLFRIEKYDNGNAYKLVHCESGSSKCQNVGSFVGDLNIPRLALRDDAFPVRFREVNPTVSSSFQRAGLRMFPYY